jgi:hypothetical protein
MKRLIAGSFALLLAALGNQLPAAGSEAGSTYEGEQVVANQLIVSIDKGASSSEISELFSQCGKAKSC